MKQQITKIENKIKDNMVLVAKIPFAVDDDQIYPISRKHQIDSCSSEKVKQQKFYTWKLLELLLNRSDIDIKDVDFRCIIGRWECDDFYFSISHSDDLVAVAISSCPIGIDIENMDREAKSNGFVERILHPNEIARPNISFARLWTRKEALFKCLNQNLFVPNNIDTTTANYSEVVVSCGEDRYILTVAHNVELDLKVELWGDELALM